MRVSNHYELPGDDRWHVTVQGFAPKFVGKPSFSDTDYPETYQELGTLEEALRAAESFLSDAAVLGHRFDYVEIRHASVSVMLRGATDFVLRMGPRVRM